MSAFYHQLSSVLKISLFFITYNNSSNIRVAELDREILHVTLILSDQTSTIFTENQKNCAI